MHIWIESHWSLFYKIQDYYKTNRSKLKDKKNPLIQLNDFILKLTKFFHTHNKY